MIPELPITALFLIAPAFLTVWVSREFSSISSDNQLDSNTLALQALTLAAVVLGLEFLLLSIGSAVDDRWRIWGGLSARQFFSEEPWAHVQHNPGSIVWVAAAEYCLHLALFIVLGLVNPVGRLLHRQLAEDNLFPEDPFLLGVEGAREALQAAETFALVRLDDGTVYTGSIRAISLQPRADGTRDFFLQNVQRQVASGEWEAVGAVGTGGLLLSSEHVLAIELSYPAPSSTNAEDVAHSLSSTLTS